MKRFLCLLILLALPLHGATKTCTFTAADGTELSTYSASGELAWTEATGSLATGNIIISDANRARTDTTNTSFYYTNNWSPATYNYDIEATVNFITVPASNNTYLGIGGRATSTSAQSGYMAWLARSSGVWQIQLARAGSATLTTVNISTPTNGQNIALKLVMRDHYLKVSWDGTEVINYKVDTTSANFLTSAGNASLYMDGVTSFLSNTTGIHLDDFTVTDATTPQTTGTLTVSNSDLWYNGYDGTGTPKQSAFAAWRFTTAATVLKITGISDLYASKPGDSRLSLRVNGVEYPTNLSFTGTTAQTFTTYLSEGTKDIVVTAGGQSASSGSLLGCYINSIECIGPDVAPAYTLTAPSSVGKVIFYGDSIATGFNASAVEKLGVIPLLRNQWGKNVQGECYGSRTLAADGYTSGARTTFAARLAGYFPDTNARAIFYFQMGTNDFSGAGPDDWNATDFGTAYADLIDKTKALLPNAVFYLQSPFQRISPTNESANSFGNTLTDYRTQISTIAAARSSYCTYIEAAAGAVVPNAGVDSDGLHLNNAGQLTWAQYVLLRIWGSVIGGAGASVIGGAGSTIVR